LGEMSRKQPISLGDTVVWHTGFYGGEQGSFYPTWWPNDRIGRVVKCQSRVVLIEFKDSERHWAPRRDVERRDVK